MVIGIGNRCYFDDHMVTVERLGEADSFSWQEKLVGPAATPPVMTADGLAETSPVSGWTDSRRHVDLYHLR